MAHVPAHRLALVSSAAFGGVRSCQGSHIRRGYSQDALPSDTSYRGLEERHRGAERVQIDIVERSFGEEYMHVLVGRDAVVEMIQLDVALYPRHGRFGNIICYDFGAGDFVRDAHRSGSRRGHSISHGDGIASEGAEQHDADVPVEGHLFVEENRSDLLSRTVGRMNFGDEDLGASLADNGAFQAQTFSPLIRRTILYGSRLRLVGVTSRMRTSSLLLMSCRSGFLDFL